MKRKRNRPAGSVCEMVELVKEIQQLDFGRRYCRYISEHFDKYIILILANLRIVRNVIRNFREKTTMTRHYKYKHGNEHHLPHPQEGCLHSSPPPQEGYVYTPPPPMTKSQTKRNTL